MVSEEMLIGGVYSISNIVIILFSIINYKKATGGYKNLFLSIMIGFLIDLFTNLRSMFFTPDLIKSVLEIVFMSIFIMASVYILKELYKTIGKRVTDDIALLLSPQLVIGIIVVILYSLGADLLNLITGWILLTISLPLLLVVLRYKAGKYHYFWIYFASASIISGASYFIYSYFIYITWILWMFSYFLIIISLTIIKQEAA